MSISIWLTLFVFGVVSAVAYFFLFSSPKASEPRAVTDSDNNTKQNQQHHQQQQRQRAEEEQEQRRQPNLPSRTPRQTIAAERTTDYSNHDDDWFGVKRTPPHMSDSAAKKSKTASDFIGSDGLVSFKSTRAGTYEKRNFTADEMTQNRRERVGLFSKILAMSQKKKQSQSSNNALPSRGKTIVVSIPSGDIACAKLRRILYLLGTYFNLIVVIHFEDDQKAATKNHKAMVDTVAKLQDTLRGTESDQNPGSLPIEVLPNHRILVSQTEAGRIAVVRQLGSRSVEFVLDFKSDVEKELSRFGFQILLYGDEGQGDKQGSLSKLAAHFS